VEKGKFLPNMGLRYGLPWLAKIKTKTPDPTGSCGGCGLFPHPGGPSRTIVIHALTVLLWFLPARVYQRPGGKEENRGTFPGRKQSASRYNGRTENMLRRRGSGIQGTLIVLCGQVRTHLLDVGFEGVGHREWRVASKLKNGPVDHVVGEPPVLGGVKRRIL